MEWNFGDNDGVTSLDEVASYYVVVVVVGWSLFSSFFALSTEIITKVTYSHLFVSFVLINIFQLIVAAVVVEEAAAPACSRT